MTDERPSGAVDRCGDVKPQAAGTIGVPTAERPPKIVSEGSNVTGMESERV